MPRTGSRQLKHCILAAFEGIQQNSLASAGFAAAVSHGLTFCLSSCAQLSINFGHELVTSVHTPIAWSDKRPTDEEFRTSFGATRLSSQRLLQFVRRRAHCIRRLVLQNSEGYWCGE